MLQGDGQNRRVRAGNEYVDAALVHDVQDKFDRVDLEGPAAGPLRKPRHGDGGGAGIERRRREDKGTAPGRCHERCNEDQVQRHGADTRGRRMT